MKEVWLVTGANRGLGLEISAGIQAHGHDVVLACRRTDACAAAVEDLNSRHPSSSSSSSPSNPSPATSSSPRPPGRAFAAPAPLDLSSPRSVFEFVEAMGSSDAGGLRLDGVVLNAGVSPSPPSRPTKARAPLQLPLPLDFPGGWSRLAVDEALATNHVGHFALLLGLARGGVLRPETCVPGSKEGAAKVRVVAVSSRASAAGRFEASDVAGAGRAPRRERGRRPLDDMAPRLDSAFRSYARSKLANVLLARELSRRGLRGERGRGEGEGAPVAVEAVASSPGLVSTPLATRSGLASSAAESVLVASWLPGPLREIALALASSVAERAAAAFGQSPEKGARSTVFAATAASEELFPPPRPTTPSPSRAATPSPSSRAATEGGAERATPPFAFVHGRKRAEWLLSSQARDDELARELWEATEAVVREAERKWNDEREEQLGGRFRMKK